MKKILFIYAVLIFNIAFAQERIIDPENSPENYVPQRGDYIINHFVDSFVGEYNFSQNEIDFYMKLEKKKFCYDYTGVCYDRLYGELELKQNNNVTIIEKKKTPSKEKIKSSDFKDSVPQITSILVENNRVSLSIEDSIKGKSVEGILTKLENGKYSLKLKERGGINIIRPGKEKQKGFTLPEEMVLKKVE